VQPSPLVMANNEAKSLWREQIELGLLPNIYFDTAALPAYVSEESYPFPTAGRYIQEAIECIGISKVMWGTDVPALLTTATYKQLLSAAYTQLDFLDETARSMVLGGNALNVFRRRR
jgi:predicted TIM-barrel fold metal-dependent hydrolase